MTADCRQRVLELYHRTLACEEEDREGFLNSACDGDESLRHEVEALLAKEPPTGFLEVPGLKLADGKCPRLAGLPRCGPAT